ncbi:MAG: hypothetical protein H8K03_12215 [Nitrospira sp.]
MATEDDKKPSIAAIIALVGITAGGYFVYQGPLISSRPVMLGTSDKRVIHGDDRVQARLWEDPFEAVQIHREKEKDEQQHSSCGSNSSNHHDIACLAWLTGNSPSQVLAIISDGSPYAESVESRLQQRYALVAGLNQADYLPENPELIRFILWPEQNACSKNEGGHCYWTNTAAPIEVFRKGNSNSVLLVLWLKDQDLGPKPLSNLNIIAGLLKDQLHIASFKVIGPRFSGTLSLMTKELEDVSFDRQLEIYSPFSTADTLAGINAQELEAYFDAHGVVLHRAIGSDRLLAEALLREMKLRRFCLDSCIIGSPAKIVLIGEWDTQYARDFAGMFQALHPQGLANLLQVSYLAGLDGELPSKKKEADRGVSKKESSDDNTRRSRAEWFAELEHPEGRSQLDYIRRIERRIKEFMRSNERLAIGVVGSDVYDKLLVLQALREHFPRALFFTTDLDERLMHPTELGWTRNLIVASHYGLRLGQKLQGPILPFRNSYQSSFFLATQWAAGKQFTQLNINEVRIYEVGSQGAVDLTNEKAGCLAYIQENINLTCLHPERQPFAFSSGIINVAKYVLLPMLTLCLITIPLSRKSFEEVRRALSFFRSGRGLLACILFIVIVCLGIGVVTIDGYDGEPFTFTDGVSTWPAYLIRCIAGALAVSGIWFMRMRLQGDKRNGQPSTFRIVMRFIKMWLGRHISLVRLSEVCQLPATDRLCEHWESLVARAVVHTTLLLLIGLLLFGIYGFPTTPCRGLVNCSLNYVILLVFVGPVITFQLFLVLDVFAISARHIIKGATAIVTPTDEQGVRKLVNKIDVIGEWTDHIDEFIYFPVGTLALMVIARSSYFDNWDIPQVLVGLWSVIGLYIIIAALQLRRAAERNREQVIDAFKGGSLALRQQIEDAKKYIEAMRKGAFASFADLPVVRAVAVPSGITALIYILDTVSTRF